jgi:hypothetical protein
MKKEAISLFILILAFPLISAQTTCSDGNSVVSSQKEIEENSVKVIKGMGIGVIRAAEVPLFQRFTADLIIDAEHVSLSNETSTKELNLLAGNYDISLNDTSQSGVTIEVDGSSKSIEEDEVKRVGGLFVLLTEFEHSTETPNAKVIAGTDQFILSNDENPSEITNLDDDSYLIELFSASDNSASIKVSRCDDSDIIEETTVEKPENQTIQETNQSNENKTKGNQSITSPKLENLTQINNETNISYKNSKTDNEQPGIFRRFLNWMKVLFS